MFFLLLKIAVPAANCLCGALLVTSRIRRESSCLSRALSSGSFRKSSTKDEEIRMGRGICRRSVLATGPGTIYEAELHLRLR